MFTGIVTDVGTVRSAEQRGDLRLRIATGYDLDTVELGASIACSGVCLTVVDKGDDWFAVDVSGETVSRTRRGPVARRRAAQPRALAAPGRRARRPYRHRARRCGRRSRRRLPRRRFDADRHPRARELGADDRAQGLDRARRRVADGQRGRRCGRRNDPFLRQHHSPYGAAHDLRRHRRRTTAQCRDRRARALYRPDAGRRDHSRNTLFLLFITLQCDICGHEHDPHRAAEAIIATGEVSRAGLARAAGLHPNSLRKFGAARLESDRRHLGAARKADPARHRPRCWSAPRRSSTRRATGGCSSSSTTKTARMRATSSFRRRWRRPTRSTSWPGTAAA